MSQKDRFAYALKDAMDEVNITFSVKKIGSHIVFLTPWPPGISNDFDLSFRFEIVLIDTGVTQLQCRLIKGIDSSKKDRMLSVLNAINIESPFMKFFIDNDNDVLIEYHLAPYPDPIENADKILIALRIMAKDINMHIKKILTILLSH